MSLMVNMELNFLGSSKTTFRPPCSKCKGLSSSAGSEKPVKYLLLFLCPACRSCIYNPCLIDFNYSRLWILIYFSPSSLAFGVGPLWGQQNTMGHHHTNHEIPKPAVQRFQVASMWLEAQRGQVSSLGSHSKSQDLNPGCNFHAERPPMWVSKCI